MNARNAAAGNGMAARSYDLDTNAAREANSGGKRITEAGAYLGKIKQAWAETNDNGTEGVFLSFEADNGQEAGPLALYTFNSKGDPLPSFKTLSAILACCKLRSIRPRPGQIEVYDYDKQEVVKKNKAIFPELFGKEIGFVFQLEEYVKQRGENEGKVGTRLVIFAPYEAGSERMAAEILDSAREATALHRVIEYIEKNPVKPLKDKDRRKAEQASQGGGYGGGYGSGYGSGQQSAPPVNDFHDDDIPF